MANQLTVKAGSVITILLAEVDDSGFARVNGNHFDLSVDSHCDVTQSMRNGINKIRFTVRNTGASTPVGTLPGGAWKGTFELYVNGRMAGRYANKGDDGLFGVEHIVGEIDILAVT